MHKRVVQIDYLKCVFIVLMVMFHLVYVGDKYPYAKQVVYSFHMPAFLVISGYLANMDKSAGRLFRQVWWLFVPYSVMESGYVVMASLLPIREHIDNLTAGEFAVRLLLRPLGPYWYLHTLMVCYLVYYAVSRLCPRLGALSFVCVAGVALYALSRSAHVVAVDNAMYFLAGVLVRRGGARFMSVFMPSLLAAVPFLLLCVFYPGDMYKHTLAGVLATCLAISFALGVHPLLPAALRRVMAFVGSNTLPILLFSPMFTIMAKLFVPVFAFDPTAVLFTVVSVAFVVAGSFAVAYAMDKARLSRWFCGKGRLLVTGLGA